MLYCIACIVQENTHMPPIEGIGNSRGVGRGSSKTKQFKGKYEAKLEFPGGGGLRENPSCEGGMGIFWNHPLHT